LHYEIDGFRREINTNRLSFFLPGPHDREAGTLTIRGSPAMELRNHPAMVCDGVRVWPPTWLQTCGAGWTSVFGEVGTLRAVFISQPFSNKVYLVINTDEESIYMGALMFEKPKLAQAVFDLLRSCINKTLTSIGALDLPESFGEVTSQRPHRLVVGRTKLND